MNVTEKWRNVSGQLFSPQKGDPRSSSSSSPSPVPSLSTLQYSVLLVGGNIWTLHDPVSKHSSCRKLRRSRSFEASKANLSEEKHGGSPRRVRKCQRKSLPPLRLHVQADGYRRHCLFSTSPLSTRFKGQGCWPGQSTCTRSAPPPSTHRSCGWGAVLKQLTNSASVSTGKNWLL